MGGTKNHSFDQNWKTLKPGAWTSGFTNVPELIEAYRFKLLKSLMKIGKIPARCARPNKKSRCTCTLVKSDSKECKTTTWSADSKM